MSDPNTSHRQGSPAPRGRTITATSLVAMLIWMGISVGLVWMSPVSSGPVWTLRAIGFILPILLIALAAGLAAQRESLRGEAARLRRDLEALRDEMRRPSTSDPDPVVVAPKAPTQKDPAPRATRQPNLQGVETSSRGPEHRVPPAPNRGDAADPQASLALDPARTVDLPPLSLADLILALHFPQTAEDKDGFRALRRALRDHRAGEVLRAAQDILTLLSQDGLYMDDLPPDPAGPDLWRRFARDERDPELARLGGIHDARSLELCRARLHQDTVFRDAAHHFLRRFDKMLADVEPQMADEDLTALTDTRSARAFMLIGRAAGVFDRA